MTEESSKGGLDARVHLHFLIVTAFAHSSFHCRQLVASCHDGASSSGWVTRRRRSPILCFIFRVTARAHLAAARLVARILLGICACLLLHLLLPTVLVEADPKLREQAFCCREAVTFLRRKPWRGELHWLYSITVATLFFLLCVYVGVATAVS